MDALTRRRFLGGAAAVGALAALRPATAAAREASSRGFPSSLCLFSKHLPDLDVWDVVPALETLDPRWAGYYFDVRHAVVEDGDAGWRMAFLAVAPRLKMIAIKDFFWEKTARGWQQRHCPLGDGMVPWSNFFEELTRTSFAGPISLHLEYDVPGATPLAKREQTLAAAARDLGFLKAALAKAYGASAGAA